jgi:cytoplasmic iron level regulating protein YaaA (DUF328/UPF0246 family)
MATALTKIPGLIYLMVTWQYLPTVRSLVRIANLDDKGILFLEIYAQRYLHNYESIDTNPTSTYAFYKAWNRWTHLTYKKIENWEIRTQLQDYVVEHASVAPQHFIVVLLLH